MENSSQLRTNRFDYATNSIDLVRTYNAAGTLVSSNAYNTNHQVVAHYNALNETTVFSYNPDRQLAATIFPNGLTVTNTFHPDHQLASSVTVGFATNSYTYTNNLVHTHTGPRGLTVTNTWDALNRLTSTTFPDGTYVSNVYDRLDLTATRDRLGHWTRTGYDSLRRPAATTNALNQITFYTYCTCGALESVLDAGGNLTSFYYDNQGNLTNTTYADGFATFSTYNLLRQVVVSGNSAGQRLTNTYNHQGLVTAVSNSLGRVSARAYDLLDRVTNSVDANGVSVAITFDPLNRPLKRQFITGAECFGYSTNVAGYTSHTNLNGHVTRLAYDALGRRTDEEFPGVSTNHYHYNGAGDLLTLTDGNNQTTTWEYNEYGWVTNKLDGLNRTAFRYAYNANGWLTNRWTPEKGDTGYSYDDLGNRKSIVYPGNTIAYDYDALNRMTNMTDDLGQTRFTYTAAGQLSGESNAWTQVSYTYTNRLRRTLSISESGTNWTQSFAYDPAGRLTNTTSPAGPFAYAYDSQRPVLMTGIHLPNGAKIVNSYDTAARLAGTALNNYWGHTLDGYTYTPDALGLRTNILRNLGLTSSSVTAGYDSIGQLTSWTASETNGTPRQQEQLAYAYDAAGNLRLRTNGGLVQSFTVDAANQLNSITRSGTFTLSGATPAPATNVTVNALIAEVYGDFTFARTNLALADGQNNFTSTAHNVYGAKTTNTLTVNFPQTVALVYDANGNLTNDGLKSLAYDAENQLTSVTLSGQWREEYFYDGMNRRRLTREYIWSGSDWILSAEKRYIYAGNGVVQERDGNNAVQVTYTRGVNGLLARQSTLTNELATVFYHADGNGNITALMDGQENIVGRYLYDPFGRLIGQWGTQASFNRYRFAGKEWNERTGFAYFGRRYYAPSLQRFLNHDPISERGGLNLYAYCQNNPVCLIDLMGFWPCWWEEGWVNIYENWGEDAADYAYGIGLGAEGFMDGIWNISTDPVGTVQNFGTWAGTVSTDPLGYANTAYTTIISGLQTPQGIGQMVFGIEGGLATGGLMSDLRAVSASAAEGTTAVRVGDYTLTDTVAGHLGERIGGVGDYSGSLSRPYLQSPSTINEIIATGKGVPDPGGLSGALRYDVPGAFRDSAGNWELVVDPNTQTIYHFNFTTGH